MPPTEPPNQGFQDLVDTLGYVDAVRFIKQFDQGHGDYTKDRTQWLDHLTLDEILSPDF
ncbi:hypothetical protein GFS31_26480 [Leptolyngbya sp. BL0902]|uniref:hypothetical protein n=1 Tax=Leptolyngbya sp. BL0902 TaxID=1115757 RepID=UPI0018E71312|nr:hypothetical protein [Leptolyngbya sp. BL0902]QQE65954.1 hypothetical protein GFS31_26480 [Leptolyngbya sp. BL0902]